MLVVASIFASQILFVLDCTPHALKLPGQPQAVTRGVNQAHEGQQRATTILVTTALRAVKAAARRFAVQCLYTVSYTHLTLPTNREV